MEVKFILLIIFILERPLQTWYNKKPSYFTAFGESKARKCSLYGAQIYRIKWAKKITMLKGPKERPKGRAICDVVSS